MKIKMNRSTMVKPIEETPGDTIWLSNVDLLMPAAYHTPAVYFYRYNGATDFFDPAVLKAALSHALVEFYPYAGRLNTRSKDNRLEINCNAEGVLFVEAECDATLDDLGDFAPKPELRLVPTVDYSQGISTYPLSLIQLTRFKCGGVTLGLAIEHRLADGASAVHFTNSWSAIVRGEIIDNPPLFLDRTILAARDPPRPQFPHVEYQPPPTLKTADDTTFSIFKLTRDQLNTLKAQCKGNINFSTFEVVTGHVWRCVCVARGLPAEQETKLHMPVDGRSRLQPPIPLGYLGNVVFSTTPIALCGELASNPLSFAVGKVHAAIARLDDDYLRSAIDHLELLGDVCAIARGSHTTKCPNLGLISWVRLPLYDVDFGWGKPIYTGPGDTPCEGKGYLLRSPQNDGSLQFGVTLLKQHMELFEKLLYDTTLLST